MKVRTQRDWRNSLIFTILGGLVVFTLVVTVIAPLANRMMNPPPAPPTATPLPATATSSPTPVECDLGRELGLSGVLSQNGQRIHNGRIYQCLPSGRVADIGPAPTATQPATSTPAPTATIAPTATPRPTTCGVPTGMHAGLPRFGAGAELIIGNVVLTCRPDIADPADDGWISTKLTFEPEDLGYCEVKKIGPNGDSLWFRPGSQIQHEGRLLTCVGGPGAQGDWDP